MSKRRIRNIRRRRRRKIIMRSGKKIRRSRMRKRCYDKSRYCSRKGGGEKEVSEVWAGSARLMARWTQKPLLHLRALLTSYTPLFALAPPPAIAADQYFSCTTRWSEGGGGRRQ